VDTVRPFAKINPFITILLFLELLRGFHFPGDLFPREIMFTAYDSKFGSSFPHEFLQPDDTGIVHVVNQIADIFPTE